MEVLKQSTQALIGSQFSYCSAIWGNATIGEIGRLQKAQNKAARTVLMCVYDTPGTELHNTLGWLTVNDTINKSLLRLCCNVPHAKKPRAICDRLHLVRDRHSANTRTTTGTIYVSILLSGLLKVE